MPHINGCVIILTTFFIYSMLNGKSLYLVHVTPKGERIWPTKVSTSLTSGGEICRNVVKEMFVNVRWSATGDETNIQIKPHLYQANHWPMWNWKMCWAQTSDIKMHIYTVLLSLSPSCCSETTKLCIRVYCTITLNLQAYSAHATPSVNSLSFHQLRKIDVF